MKQEEEMKQKEEEMRKSAAALAEEAAGEGQQGASPQDTREEARQEPEEEAPAAVPGHKGESLTYDAQGSPCGLGLTASYTLGGCSLSVSLSADALPSPAGAEGRSAAAEKAFARLREAFAALDSALSSAGREAAFSSPADAGGTGKEGR